MMVADSHRNGQRLLSVVIASYNSAKWLPSTIASLCASLQLTDWVTEIVVVDDGSTDGTATTLDALRPGLPYPLTVVAQENKGRFLARWEGIRRAAHDDVLILDSRLLVHERSFEYLDRALRGADREQPWNGHVDTDPGAPLVGQFWSVPTYVFWGSYLSNPRPMQITLDNFDRLPKGTGFLFVSKELFERACLDAWPEANAHLTSDDTKLLRFIAAETPIRLDPGFSATYRPRTTLRQFLSHSFERGTLFVDSYAGTSTLRNLILVGLAVLPIAGVALLVVLAVAGIWPVFGIVVAVAVAALLVPFFVALARKCHPRALLSYLVFVVPFGFSFVAGLARGLVVHRRTFSGSRTRTKPKVDS